HSPRRVRTLKLRTSPLTDRRAIRQNDVRQELILKDGDPSLDRFELRLDHQRQRPPARPGRLLPLLASILRMAKRPPRRRQSELIAVTIRHRQQEPDVLALHAEGDNSPVVVPAIHELVSAVASQKALDLCAALIGADGGSFGVLRAHDAVRRCAQPFAYASAGWVVAY